MGNKCWSTANMIQLKALTTPHVYLHTRKLLMKTPRNYVPGTMEIIVKGEHDNQGSTPALLPSLGALSTFIRWRRRLLVRIARRRWLSHRVNSSSVTWRICSFTTAQQHRQTFKIISGGLQNPWQSPICALESQRLWKSISQQIFMHFRQVLLWRRDWRCIEGCTAICARANCGACGGEKHTGSVHPTKYEGIVDLKTGMTFGEHIRFSDERHAWKESPGDVWEIRNFSKIPGDNTKIGHVIVRRNLKTISKIVHRDSN